MNAKDVEQKNGEKQINFLKSLCSIEQQNELIGRILDCIMKGVVKESQFTLRRRVLINVNGQNVSSVLKCNLRRTGKEQNVELVLSGGESERVIQMSMLREVLRYVSYKDVVPSMMDLESVSSVYEICKYFILPFVWVENKTIKLFPCAQGILGE